MGRLLQICIAILVYYRDTVSIASPFLAGGGMISATASRLPHIIIAIKCPLFDCLLLDTCVRIHN